MGCSVHVHGVATPYVYGRDGRGDDGWAKIDMACRSLLLLIVLYPYLFQLHGIDDGTHFFFILPAVLGCPLGGEVPRGLLPWQFMYADVVRPTLRHGISDRCDLTC